MPKTVTLEPANLVTLATRNTIIRAEMAKGVIVTLQEEPQFYYTG